ncbi:MAG: transketolase C-terminal domain-containing protein [Bacteroidota bacterium]|nr:transketolase C-terminal domain-containing protein [Bacteroidota bacterium]
MKINFGLAINQALHQLFSTDENIMLIGQGVKSPWYVGNTCTGLIDRFGENRVIDTPVSENAMTGIAVGSAITGMKSIVVHPRVDFVLYAMDPIINQAANWHFMNGGKSCVPVVFWLIINRGGEQAAQHSQALHALFTHIPGLKVIAPSTPYDVKGMLVSAINDMNPVVFIDDRWLYRFDEDVPEELYKIPLGKGVVRNSGNDLTIVSFSYTAKLCEEAVKELQKYNISAEFIDLRTIKPLDEDIILNSVNKTGRLLIVDGAWRFNGVSSEIAAIIAEKAFNKLKAPLRRLTLPDTPAPASSTLEDVYYIKSSDIVKSAIEILKF